MAKPLHPLGTKDNFEMVQWILDPKVIDGALRSAIHAHGPITLGNHPFHVIEQDEHGEWHYSVIRTCSTSSASKRIRGAVRTRIVEYLKKKSETPLPKWYDRFVRLGRS